MRTSWTPCLLLVGLVACGSKQPSNVSSPSGAAVDGSDDTGDANTSVTGQEPTPSEASVSPLVAVAHDDELRVMEPGGEVVARLPAPEVQSGLAVSPSGRMIAAGRGFAPSKKGWTKDGTIWLWKVDDELQGGAELAPDVVLDGHKREMVVALAFTADGTGLMSAGDRGRLILWDVGTGKVRQQWTIPYASMASMNDDGTWFVTHHLDGARLWSRDKKKGTKLPVPASCMDSAFAPDSNRFAVVCKNVVYEFEAPGTKPVRELKTELSYGRGVSYSKRHLTSLYKENQAIVWDRESGEVAAKVDFDASNLGDAYRLTFDDSGNVLGAAFCSDVRGYDLAEEAVAVSLSIKPVRRCRPALVFVPR